VKRPLAAAIGLALTAGLLITPVLAANPNRDPLHLNKHTGGMGYPPPYGLTYCYDEDDFEEWWYLGWMQPGETFTASLRFCDGQDAGDYYVRESDGKVMWIDDGNTMFFLSVKGKNAHYAISFEGSSLPDDPDYPLYAAEVGDRPYELWQSCHPAPGAWVTFTITYIGERSAETSLRFGSTHYTATSWCP